MPWMLRTVLGFSLTKKSSVIAHKLQRQRLYLLISLSLVSDAVLAATLTALAIAAANGYPARTVTNYSEPFT